MATQETVVLPSDLLRQAQIKAGLGNKINDIYEAATLFDLADQKVTALLDKSEFALEERVVEFLRRDTWSVKALVLVDHAKTEAPQDAKPEQDKGLYMFSEDYPDQEVLKDPFAVDPFGVYAPKRRVQLGLAGKLHFFGEEGVCCEAYLETKIDGIHRGSYPFYRLYKVLAESGLIAVTDGMRELASKDGKVTWSFADLGFAKPKRLSTLFEEFAQGNESLLRLAGHGEVFDPKPAKKGWSAGGYGYGLRPDDDRFVPYTGQSRVLLGWHSQLEEYRGSLFVRP